MHHENEKMALFEALYREYLVPLKKYAYRIGVGYDDIEDMVHEAFIEYYKRYSLDLDHKVKLVLLIRILRSKLIDNRRQMRRREMLHLEDPDAEEEIMNLLLEGEIGIQLLDQEVIDRDIYWNVWKIVKSIASFNSTVMAPATPNSFTVKGVPSKRNPRIIFSIRKMTP